MYAAIYISEMVHDKIHNYTSRLIGNSLSTSAITNDLESFQFNSKPFKSNILKT